MGITKFAAVNRDSKVLNCYSGNTPTRELLSPIAIAFNLLVDKKRQRPGRAAAGSLGGFSLIAVNSWVF
jgi:hypothetical protein